ncbi:hypothetical protein [Chryseobacterium sp. MA9]|uniref:tetratricopeptide repeat protein n=1 Tax=Chryseobacterium sp. MA9 TaxID=2966625 RepID=UPI002107C6BF|nr:hypothetical protein [Chryseobacterium sp. MA9]UTX48885.1 hypothetical protein KIK00_01035 [Chryseobacterium sp. MA9]
MKNILLFLFTSLILNSCRSSQNDLNEYFHAINGEVSVVIDQPKKIKALYDRELQKYRKHPTMQYLISTKYIELSLHKDNNKKLKMVYELLKLNDDKYDYISIACNYNLALQFEQASPELALQFLDKAIELDEKSGKKYFLPHLFHLKGRWFYNKKNYSKAFFYFKKCLDNLDKNDILYIASMHNNFALCYSKMNKVNLAIEETNKAITILEKKTNKIPEDKLFLNYIKGNLGDYFFQKKDYQKAEILISEELKFYHENNYSDETINPSKRLFTLYTTTNNTIKLRELITFLINNQYKLESLVDKIETNKIIQLYYSNNNDIKNLKYFSKKLIELNEEYNEKSKQNLSETSDLLNNYVIKNVNQKYDYQKKKSFLLILLVLLFSLAIIIFIYTIINIRRNSKKEKEIAEKQKIILNNKKEILQQGLKIQAEKINSLYLSLNLKIETEKAFLESLKKIKKQKNTDPEEIFKDLLLKVNNLLQIDRRNYDLINESSLQNELFINKLSDKFPMLTKQELKLCVYFKLDLSSKEISSFESTTPNTIRVYKAKIKSKMKLERETELNSFLATI